MAVALCGITTISPTETREGKCTVEAWVAVHIGSRLVVSILTSLQLGISIHITAFASLLMRRQRVQVSHLTVSHWEQLYKC